MALFANIFQVVVKGTLYDFPVLSKQLYSIITGTNAIHLEIMSEDRLLKKLIEGISIIRMGDGEAMLMTGRDIHYQKTSWKLRNELRLILDTYSKTSPYILGIPVDGLTAHSAELKKKNRYRVWRLFRNFASLRIKLNLPYADAHSFYYQDFIHRTLPSLLKGKNLICITRASIYDRSLQEYLAEHSNLTQFVAAPETDAFATIENLEETINALLQMSTEKPLLLLAAGPTSKVLAYRYALRGIQCIDIGHGIEIIGRNTDYSHRI